MNGEKRVLIPPDIHVSAHLVSDVDYWREWFRKLSNINEQHSRQLAEFADSAQQYSQRLNLHESEQIDEMGFYADLKCVQTHARTRSENLRKDSWQYKRLAETIDKYKPGVMYAGHIDLECVDRHYKDAKKKLTAQTKAVDRQMKAYHKASFERENLIIRAKLATSEETLKDTENKIRRQIEKADDMLYKYKRQISRWQESLEEIKDRSERYEEVYLKQQEWRADLVLSCLRESVIHTHSAGNIHRDFMFEGINGKNIIEKKAIRKEKLSPPEFKEYSYTGDINAQYEKAKSALDNMDTELMNTQLTAFQVNNLLKNARKSHQFEVVTSHTKQNIGELDLRVGDRLVQILPPNEVGIAYGELSSGVLRKPKRGFYPASCVKFILDISREKRLLHAIDSLENATKSTEKHTTKRQPAGEFNNIENQPDEVVPGTNSGKTSRKKFFSKERFMKSVYGIEIGAINTIVDYHVPKERIRSADTVVDCHVPMERIKSADTVVDCHVSNDNVVPKVEVDHALEVTTFVDVPLSEESDDIGGEFIVNRFVYDHEGYGDYILDSDSSDDATYDDSGDESNLLEDIEGCWAGGGDQ